MSTSDARPLRRLLSRLSLVLLVAAAPVGAYFAPEEGPSYPAVWDARVLPIVHFVEQARGLRFRHPVAVDFLTDAAFVEKVKDPAPSAQDKTDAERWVAELRAVGLVSGHPDILKAHNDLVSAEVVGVYMPDDKTLYVRGTDLTPYTRATAAHELTHALQDQYFDLDALRSHVAGGDDTAVTALIEGDAVRVENAYVEALSDDDKATYHEESSALQSGGDDASKEVPQFLKDQLALPYVFGPVLLDTLVADGGNASVDRAFRTPPQADAQVVDPAAFPIGWKPAHLGHPVLPAGAKPLERDVPFGQVELLEVLGSRLGFARPWQALQGWDGDVARPYRLGTSTCVAIDVRLTDAAGAQALAGVMRSWAKHGEGVTVAGTTASLRACDPGADAVTKQVQPTAFTVLSTRAALINEFMQHEGAGFLRARCVTDRVLDTVGEQLFTVEDFSALTPARQEQVRAAVRSAIADC